MLGVIRHVWTRFPIFCFFKQKTAYELRISDWSSDVCSSDLPCPLIPLGGSSRGNLYGRGFGLSRSVWLLGKSHGDGRPAGSGGIYLRAYRAPQVGRASCRERACQYV